MTVSEPVASHASAPARRVPLWLRISIIIGALLLLYLAAYLQYRSQHISYYYGHGLEDPVPSLMAPAYHQLVKLGDEHENLEKDLIHLIFAPCRELDAFIHRYLPPPPPSASP